MKLIEDSLKPKRKRYNKNKKKAWRKKIDLSDIERVHEEQEREERFGGPIEARVSDDLFIIDDGSKKEEKKDNATSILPGKTKEKLRCHYLLDGLPGVKAISKKGPTLAQKEPKMLRSARKVSGNTLNDVLKRTTVKEQRKKSLRQNKRLKSSAVKFNKDLWAQNDKDLACFDEVGKSFMKEPMQYYREQVKKHKVKIPSVRFAKPSFLPSVAVPSAGASYNPSLEDHQKLLSVALQAEKKRKKKEKNIKRLEKRIFSDKVGITPKQQLLEMSEGLPFTEKSLTPVDDADEIPEDEVKSEQFRPAKVEKKSNKSKRKKIAERMKENNRNKMKQRRINENQIFRVKSIAKELDEAQERSESARRRRRAIERKKMKQTKRLAETKFEDEDIVAPLGNEISGGLRSMQPRVGNLGSSMKNLQKRNIIETRNPKAKLSKKKQKTFVDRNVKQNLKKFAEKLNL